MKEFSSLAATAVKFFHYINDRCLEFICFSCEQVFYRDQVEKVSDKFALKVSSHQLFGSLTMLPSVESKVFVCKTCKGYLQKLSVPPKCTLNGFKYEEISTDIKDLTLLEQHLVALRVPFITILEQPNGGQLSCRGVIVNVPNTVTETIRVIPRNWRDTELLCVDLKRRCLDKHSYISSYIRPSAVHRAAELLISAELYVQRGIIYDYVWSLDNVSKEYEFLIDQEDQTVSNTDDNDENEQLLGCSDTLVYQHPLEPESNQKLVIAPTEKNSPISLFTDVSSEELAYSSLFGGRARAEHKYKTVPYSTICKAELQSRFGRFRRHRTNKFYKIKRLQFSQIGKKATIALRKRYLQNCTAKDIKENLDSILQSDRGYSFLAQQRLSPSYFKRMEKNYLAWVRQLGSPSFFLTLSMPEAHWPDLLKVLYRSKYPNSDLPGDNDLLNLPTAFKNELIREDPVSIVRHFNKKLNFLLRNVLQCASSPIGYVSDYIGSVESQFRGSVHIHLLCYVREPPFLDKEPDDVVISFIEERCSTDLLLPKLPGLVYTEADVLLPQKLQLHRLRPTCFKGRRKSCRFNFPLPPMRATAIVRPLPEDTSTADIQKARNDYLKIVNGIETLKPGAQCETTFEQFLHICGLDEEDYLSALRSSVSAPKVFLKRMPNAVRVNAYNRFLLFL